MIIRLFNLLFITFLAVVAVDFGEKRQLRAEGRACNLALVLALDASLSVDRVDYKLQIDGLAAALYSPKIRQLIVGQGGISIMAFEWGGRSNQDIIVDWQTLENETDVLRFVAMLKSHRRLNNNSSTSMGNALEFAANSFDRLPVNCFRHVIDVSGDGAHNDGISPPEIYQQSRFSRIIVNGLVIAGAYPDPEAYYRNNVLHGPGSFLVVASSFSDFKRAIREKLLREIGPRNVSLVEPAPQWQ